MLSNLADYKSDSVRRWVETNSPTPKTTTITTTPTTNNDTTTNKKTKLKINNNNTINLLPHNFWKQQIEEQRDLIIGENDIEMPMLLQQPPSHVLLATHETEQPLDFTMSKFKTKSHHHHHHHHHHNNTVASQLKNQFNNFTTQQHMMLLQSNGIYFNRTTNNNNNRSFTRGSSPSSSSEEEGVGPPASSPNSSIPSPGPLRTDGKFLILFFAHILINNKSFKSSILIGGLD